MNKKKKYYEENKDIINVKCKKYHEKNKEKINEQKKIYREQNKNIINEQRKEKYDENKNKISEQRKEKITCECGSIVRKSDIASHRKSLKHIAYIEQKNNVIL